MQKQGIKSGKTIHIKDVPVGTKFRLRGGQIYKKLVDGSHIRLNKPISKKRMRRINEEVRKGCTLMVAVRKHARGYRPHELTGGLN